MRGGVYIHVPWCHRRCPYCDFYFEVGRASDDFARAIQAEMHTRRDELPVVQSIYFGGGTPSVLPAHVIDQLVGAVQKSFTMSTTPEVTIEVNPEDLTDKKLHGWKEAGITRVSVGSQSFDDDTLKELGRAHDGKAALNALGRLGAFFSVSTDLIIGVPGERGSRTLDDFKKAADVGVEHVSAYMLTMEPNTPWEKQFRQGRRAPIDDDAQVDAYESLRDAAGIAGFRQYEISSFAKPGQESQHNRTYWSQGAYVGLGPGAHSMRLLDDGRIVRRSNIADWSRYRSDVEWSEETLEQRPAFLEAVAFGLRDLELGISIDALARRHRVEDTEAVVQQLEKLRQGGRVKEDNDCWTITRTGVLFADGIARDILAC